MAEADLSRRQFLNVSINAIGAGITAILAVPLAGYFLDPAIRQSKAVKAWVKIGPASQLTDMPQAFNFETVVVDGFMKQNMHAQAYIYTDNGVPKALSNKCTHLGCPAAFDVAAVKFFCPCHGGVYDKTGKNIGGPPPRPLPQFDAKIENGDVYISV